MVKGWENLSVADAAQSVQRSAAPDAYAQWEGQAQAMAEALTGEVPAAFSCRLPTTPRRGLDPGLVRGDGRRARRTRPGRRGQRRTGLDRRQLVDRSRRSVRHHRGELQRAAVDPKSGTWKPAPTAGRHRGGHPRLWSLVAPRTGRVTIEVLPMDGIQQECFPVPPATRMTISSARRATGTLATGARPSRHSRGT